MSNSYTFSVSEVFPDGRVMVFTYVHIGDDLTVVMDVYADVTLQGGRRYLNLRQTTGGQIPQIGSRSTEVES